VTAAPRPPDDDRPLDYKQQEVKFVEWSQGVTEDDYDIRQLLAMLGPISADAATPPPIAVLDVGGGIGTVGRVLAERLDHLRVDVVDNSVLARESFVRHDRVRLIFGDFLTMTETEHYHYVIFRTVLHHIIGASAAETRHRQRQAIEKAGRLLAPGGKIAVIENFYESYLGNDVSGEIIFQLTKLKFLAGLTRRLGANTAGEGVRFRSFDAWIRLFVEQGFVAAGDIAKQQRPMPAWQRVGLACRDRYQAIVEFSRAR
jgi:SAM-dependent methyltransferase